MDDFKQDFLECYLIDHKWTQSECGKWRKKSISNNPMILPDAYLAQIEREVRSIRGKLWHEK